MDLSKWAELQESLLKSQLRVIRQFLHGTDQPVRKERKGGRSQIQVIYDVLRSAQKPLHVTQIIEQAEKDFGIQLDRESIVSALTKKVKSGRVFQRVAPNTFTLKAMGDGHKKQKQAIGDRP
jgi:predicted transcriptional regulator